MVGADVAALPEPVRRYVHRSGAVGRPRPQNMAVRMDAAMFRRPGGRPMRASSVQYSFFGQPARLFHMSARMAGLPVQALHLYRRQAATFTVRVASAVSIVDLAGAQISAAETVTVLNDMCLMAPGSLVDDRLVWTAVDDHTADVTFTNGEHVVSATLVVDDSGELVTFWSDDRPDSSDGGLTPMRWSTPVSGYRDDGPWHLLDRGAAVYHRADGPFTYGQFRVRSITYDVAGPTPD